MYRGVHQIFSNQPLHKAILSLSFVFQKAIRLSYSVIRCQLIGMKSCLELWKVSGSVIIVKYLDHIAEPLDLSGIVTQMHYLVLQLLRDKPTRSCLINEWMDKANAAVMLTGNFENTKKTVHAGNATAKKIHTNEEQPQQRPASTQLVQRVFSSITCSRSCSAPTAQPVNMPTELSWFRQWADRSTVVWRCDSVQFVTLGELEVRACEIRVSSETTPVNLTYMGVE